MSKYAVVDFEMCSVPKYKKAECKLKCEIIQIGVILLDEAFNCIGEFQSYVCPEYGVIDDYIYKLTGISNKMVKNAPKLLDVLTDLKAWLPPDTLMVAWSKHDEKQLRHELEAKAFEGAAMELLEYTWLDCQEMFADKLETKKVYNLTEALRIANIYYCDGAHDALVDARNTALLFRKIKTENRLKLNTYYFSDLQPFSASFSLGALLGKAAS